MSKIKVMSEDLSNKIAAGEVVERISSVVKELVENSIDADSKTIIVDLLDSGTKLIRVSDDGVGMDSEDAKLAFQRHATSKLLNVDDLFFINTLGFRGEALPSIASVSKVDLKTNNNEVGFNIVIHGGKKVLEEKCTTKKGTIIEISDLFYNTPARLKYLKSDATELANVTSFIEKLALSHPEISFTLTNNERKIVYTSGSNELLKTIHEIYGYSVSSNMIEIKAYNDDYEISGYICKPSILKSNRNHISTIVNGRIVKNVELNKAINDGYYTFKPDIKYPVVVLKIETDPTLIDVNIHPTKQDIKFSKSSSLNKLVTDTINSYLKKNLLIPEIETPSNGFLVKEEETPYTTEQQTFDFKSIHKTYEEIKENVKKSHKLEENEIIKKIEMYPVGVVMGTYIIAQNDEAMFLIDQHAAQERINYERILNGLRTDTIYKTDLLIPITIELKASEYTLVLENMNILTDLGFDVEEFGVNTIVIKAHPTWLIPGLEEESVKKMVDIIIDGKYLFDRVRFQDHIAATMACKMSVKGNEAITLIQAEKILEDLVICDNPYNCPHGRPTIITYKKYELEKLFKRVMN